ncbi:MAG: hypothetical protein LH609_09665 [Rudanella sp.]|nr:hypothetical protein [Rudanella sp.]
MKSLSNSLLCVSLLSLLATAPLLATDTNPDRKLSSSGWVTAMDASFNTRIYQDEKGDLIVQVNNRSVGVLTIQMQTTRGEEVAYVPADRRPAQLSIRLDVSELTDGDYRLIVATDTEKIVTIVSLTTPASTSIVRKATVAVVRQAPEH